MKTTRQAGSFTADAADARLGSSRRARLALRRQAATGGPASDRRPDREDLLGSLRILGLLILRPGGWLPI